MKTEHKEPKTYRHGKAKLRWMRRKAEVAMEAFKGKEAIALTYEHMGKDVPEELKKRIQDKRTQLKYRGAL